MASTGQTHFHLKSGRSSQVPQRTFSNRSLKLLLRGKKVTCASSPRFCSIGTSFRIISRAMLSKTALRSAKTLQQRTCSTSLARSFASTSLRQQNASGSSHDRTTHFGFETVPEADKEGRGQLPSRGSGRSLTRVVGAVFSSVAASYDTMNDLMSLGIHRLWKDHFVRSLNPGRRDNEKGWNILDIAGGTGDIAFRMLDHATNVNGDHNTKVTISDINPDMLEEGRKRSLKTPYGNTDRLSFLQGNAESLPSIESNSIDLYTVAFGIRNFTNKDAAIREAFRVLKPGGVFACLEFSHVDSAIVNAVYKRWSFSAIPLIGQLVASDRDSYQYLVESIERFPTQEEFKGKIENAGFVTFGQGYENLSLGIASIHKGVKPV